MKPARPFLSPPSGRRRGFRRSVKSCVTAAFVFFQNHLKTVGRDEVTARAASGGEQWARRARNVGSETEVTFGRGKEGEKS